MEEKRKAEQEELAKKERLVKVTVNYNVQDDTCNATGSCCCGEGREFSCRNG